MAEDKTYSLISVNTSEDDDVVIQAGVVDAPESDVVEEAADDAALAQGDAATLQTGDAQTRADAAADDVLEDVGQDAGLPEDAAAAQAARLADEADLERLDQAASEEDRAEYLAHVRARKRRERATEMLTTEDDLHTKMPFSGMQKVIVAVLITLMVAAAVYWFFLR